MFRQTRLLDRIIPDIEAILAAGEVVPAQALQGVVGPAIPNQEGVGDAGHRA
jgi:CRISPR-associated protein Cas1